MAESHILDEEVTRESAGTVLQRGREAAGLGLDEIAQITKIPERHLQTMEAGQFSDLPARAYAVGFARSYARAVKLDEGMIAQMVREELDGASADQAGGRASSFEAGDPARIPSSRFAWIAAGAALAVVLAGYFFWHAYYSPAAELPPIAADEPEIPSATASAVTAEAAAQQVVFTATIPDVWVRLYDASGTRLLEKSLAQGESFEVPLDAEGPQLWTAHPEALTITVGGREVARLAESQQTVKDVPVDAAALLARAKSPPPLLDPVAQTGTQALARASEPVIPRPASPVQRAAPAASRSPAAAPAPATTGSASVSSVRPGSLVPPATELSAPAGDAIADNP